MRLNMIKFIQFLKFLIMGYQNRGAQILGASSPEQLNFELWLLILVNPQYGTGYI
jgi:hypothetical protein